MEENGVGGISPSPKYTCYMLYTLQCADTLTARHIWTIKLGVTMDMEASTFYNKRKSSDLTDRFPKKCQDIVITIL